MNQVQDFFQNKICKIALVKPSKDFGSLFEEHYIQITNEGIIFFFNNSSPFPLSFKSFDVLKGKLVLSFQEEEKKSWWEVFNFFLEFFSTMTIVKVKDNPELYTVQVKSDQGTVILESIAVKETATPF